MAERPVFEALTSRAKALAEAISEVEGTSRTLSNLRLLSFLVAAGLFGAAVFHALGRLALPGAGLSMVAFIALVARHAKVVARLTRLQAAAALTERALARGNGGWRQFKETGAHLADETHPYAIDLDVVGQGSLFQKLDDTATRGGERVLARTLLQGLEATEVAAQQAAVRELAPWLERRQTLLAELRDVGAAKPDPEPLLAWIENGTGLEKLRWAFVLAHVVPPVSLALGLLAALEVIEPWAALPGFVLQAAIVGLTRGPIARTFELLQKGEQDFSRFSAAFAELEAWPVTAPRLVSLKQGLSPQGSSIASRFRTFEALFGRAGLRANPQIHWFFNFTLLWDVHAFVRLERWRSAQAQGARQWIEALGELEALCCLAQAAYEHPGDAWPEVVDGPLKLEATAVAHPLLDAPVANDVSLPGPGHALVVTGSNMSGKTTYLRSMGLLAVMARAGLPVRATSATVSVRTTITSMRVKDSLERGVSYFYAEVRRIKAILEAAKASPQGTLFLLDEIFLGTNTRERQIASRALIEHLLKEGASGAITTHDLSLTELQRTTVRNVHFRDEVTNGEMTFDYRLREGVVQGSNALEILRRAGVPV